MLRRIQVAKKQTRRSVSLSRATYDVAMTAAAEAGMPMSEWVTSLIRQARPELPPQIHARPAAEPPPKKPLLAMTREDVERALAPHVRVAAATHAPPPLRKPNRTCAHCGKRPGDAIDEDGYSVCFTCSSSFAAGTWGQR